MKKDPEKSSALLSSALLARQQAYCPYSHYAVGASLMTQSGKIFAGCNIENASYGLTLCAERVAIAQAIAAGHRHFDAFCIVGVAANPCGACRQVMIEFSNKKTVVDLVNLNLKTGQQTNQRTTVYKLLPSSFNPVTSGLILNVAMRNK